MVECTYGSRRIPDSFPETLIEIEGDKGAIVSRIGSKIEVTTDGRMTCIDADPDGAALGRAALARGAGQRAAHQPRTCSRRVQPGRPPRPRAEDNLKTFALVEAAYEKAGKVRPNEPRTHRRHS